MPVHETAYERDARHERERLDAQHRTGVAAEAQRQRDRQVAGHQLGVRVAEARHAVESAQASFEDAAAAWVLGDADELRLERAEARLAKAERDLRRLEAAAGYLGA